MYCISSASVRGWRSRWLLMTSSRGVTSPLCWRVNVAREQPCFLARARYENCSPGLKLTSSVRASFNGIVALSCRGCKVTSKVGGVAHALTRLTRCTDTVTLLRSWRIITALRPSLQSSLHYPYRPRFRPCAASGTEPLVYLFMHIQGTLGRCDKPWR
jgi:hypothetical protein